MAGSKPDKTTVAIYTSKNGSIEFSEKKVSCVCIIALKGGMSSRDKTLLLFTAY